MLNDSKVMTSKFLASTAWATYFVAGLGHLGGLSHIKSGGGLLVVMDLVDFIARKAFM